MFDPVDFESFAEEILKKHTRLMKARDRTAISRAYYSCFLDAREVLLSILPIKEKRILRTGKKIDGSHINVHRLVIETFKQSPIPEHKAIGSQLDTLRDTRNDADYNLSKTFRAPSIYVLKAKQVNKSIKSLKDCKQLVKSFKRLTQVTSSPH